MFVTFFRALSPIFEEKCFELMALTNGATYWSGTLQKGTGRGGASLEISVPMLSRIPISRFPHNFSASLRAKLDGLLKPIAPASLKLYGEEPDVTVQGGKKVWSAVAARAASQTHQGYPGGDDAVVWAGVSYERT
jgi:hypothetical protein